LVQSIKNKLGSMRAGNGRSKQLEADIAHITGEMYKRNVELADTINTLSLLQKINDLFLGGEGSVGELAQNICRAIVESTSHVYVGVYKHHSQGALEHFGSFVSSSATSMPINGLELPVGWYSSDNKAITMGIDKVGLSQVYIVRLRTKSSSRLVLVVGYTDTAAQHAERDQSLFDRLSDTVGVAIEGKLLADENAHVLLQLKRSNAKLKALDEAKDEFISMASHQLRTPLTSIKGYLSMVLEGDAGPVPDDQKNMITTAYTSAQRMVYLIADLLNVSRLQTGKFVITPVDVDLRSVITSELEQLHDTIATKGLTVDYDSPIDFPAMQLDETKIRQVVMNFIDNALYYTPTGGNVVVELVDKPKSIEFLVRDNGIGVPKADQHKLFAKFFRAGNAQRARPDGTGLGLFMAQKVIVASGGAIIFKSTEGKGSTFGFTFPKK
jgi:signal transduction histidine kinase